MYIEEKNNPPESTKDTDSATPSKYAGAIQRFAAVFIDGIILNIAQFAIGMALGIAFGVSPVGGIQSNLTAQGITGLVGVAITIAYLVYFIGTKGQTPGKMAMKIKVIREDGSTEPLGYGTAFLREIIGKVISSIVFGLGFFWILWDDKKQGWHDKIAKTIVVNA